MDSVDCLSGGSGSVILDEEQPCSNAIPAQSKRVKLLNILQEKLQAGWKRRLESKDELLSAGNALTPANRPKLINGSKTIT